MTTALYAQTTLHEKSQLLGFLAFGFLVGITAVTYVLAAGGGLMAAFVAYVASGSLGFLGMAATALWSE